MEFEMLISQVVLQASSASVPSYAKISGLVLLLVSFAKTSFAQPLWDKLGNAKILVAPILSIIIAIVSIHPFSFSALYDSLLGGALAVATHELLDKMKLLPGVGPGYIKLISFFEKMLKSPKAQTSQAVAIDPSEESFSPVEQPKIEPQAFEKAPVKAKKSKPKSKIKKAKK